MPSVGGGTKAVTLHKAMTCLAAGIIFQEVTTITALALARWQFAITIIYHFFFVLVMSIVALIFVPIVLAYQGWSYYIFRQRLSTGEALEY